MQGSLSNDTLRADLESLVAAGGDRRATLQRAAERIRESGHHRWVGIYEADQAAGEVRNLVFTGHVHPTFPIFPIHQGLTGTAIREKKTVNSGDVLDDPRYLTAFGSTRSEIIVPILDPASGAVVGTIDVESDHENAFPEPVQAVLEEAAAALAPLWQAQAHE